MIKRRFYKLEHSNKDAPSQSSSSSSDSERDAEATDESEEELEVSGNDERVAEVRGNEADCPASSSSGYESEDSSANELNLDSSGVPTSDDDGRPNEDTDAMAGSFPSGVVNDETASQKNAVPEDDGIPSDIAEYAVKRKSVFKCRLCPRIVCLTMESIRAHLKSKKHARSEKLLKEGRLKVMLDDNGKLDDDTDTENAAKILYKPPKKPKRPRSEMDTKKLDKKRGKSRRPAKYGNKRHRSDS